MKISCLALLLLFCQLVIFWLQIIDNLSRKSVNNRECSISPHKKSRHRKGLGLVELAAEGLRCFSSVRSLATLSRWVVFPLLVTERLQQLQAPWADPMKPSRVGRYVLPRSSLYSRGSSSPGALSQTFLRSPSSMS